MFTTASSTRRTDSRSRLSRNGRLFWRPTGLKAALPSSTKLSDLWVRAYWKCTSPNGPMVKIFEAKFKKS